MTLSPSPTPRAPAAAARLRQLARALRAQRRLAASGRPGYDLDAHRELLRAFRKEAGLAGAAPPRPVVRARRAKQASLRAQA
jgi:hypothetical protein